jgi:hypothetical protein
MEDDPGWVLLETERTAASESFQDGDICLFGLFGVCF